MQEAALILKRAEPFLNENRELSKFEFAQLFSVFSKEEQYEIINILIENNIKYVVEKKEEKAEADRSGISEKTFLQEDYKGLMNFSNEELCILYQKGNPAALAALEEKNKPFIYRYALKLSRQFAKTNLTVEDLFQEGILGLIRAADKFDAGLHFSFLTYCGNWIQQAMSRAAIDNGYLIRFPAHVYDKVMRYNKYTARYPDYSEEQLLQLFEDRDLFDPPLDLCTFRLYKMYDTLYMNPSSLNVRVGEEQEAELEDFIPDEHSATLEEIVEENVLKYTLESVLETLAPMERQIIKLRFGLGRLKPMSPDQIAGIFELTRKRVLKMEAEALQKLREPSRSDRLKDFLD